jgi:hypothetical protein
VPVSQSKARTVRKAGLRDQLARKRAKVVTAHFPMDEHGEKAMERVEQAEKELQFGKLIKTRQGDKSDINIAGLEQAVTDAEAERDKHCLALRFRGLSEDERDALASEYLPDNIPDDVKGGERRKLEEANVVKLKEWTYHAMAAAVLESDLTADEWRDELISDRWSAGDVITCRDAIQQAYGAQPADGIPKD